MADVLYIEGCDFDEFPPGGTLNFTRQMLKVFGNRLALVGICTDDTPVGKWVKKELNGVEYDFFAIWRRKKTVAKPLIPARLSDYIRFKHYKKEILSIGIRDVFISQQEVMMAVSHWDWSNICYFFPGVANQLQISRYRYAWLLSGLFEKVFFRAVTSANIILAAADDESIRRMVGRSRGLLTWDRIISFPTRVDTSIFHPASKIVCRNDAEFPEDAIVIVTCGRIHWVKGWRFLIDVFCVFRRSFPNAHLCFIGDGHDRGKVEDYAKETGVADRVRVTGFQSPQQVATYLNAADLYVTGSYREGWATVMIEALSCGIPMVSTNVSSARVIITEDRNGYVIEDRDREKFAEAMRKAIALENVAEFSLAESEKYALKYLGRDLGLMFPPLRA